MKKRQNKKGFTLAELLIVVAIIGVLVAVSIPIFTAQLRKARIARNEANCRAAYAAAVADYLVSDKDVMSYTYNVSQGKVTEGLTNTGDTHYKDNGSSTLNGLDGSGANVTADTGTVFATSDDINYFWITFSGGELENIWPVDQYVAFSLANGSLNKGKTTPGIDVNTNGQGTATGDNSSNSGGIDVNAGGTTG